jgi:hypothetical protein
MLGYLQTDRSDLRLTLSNGDDVLDTQTAATPAEAARVAVMMIARFDELNDGDTLTCRREDEAKSATLVPGPGGGR